MDAPVTPGPPLAPASAAVPAGARILARSEAPRSRSRQRRIVELVVALVLALVVLELGARALGRLPERVAPEAIGVKDRIPEDRVPGMANALRPHAESRFTYPAAGDEPPVEIHYKINRNGFRDLVYPAERRPGTYRVAFAGDSVTFGVGIAARETVPKQLELLLADRHGRGRVEVMNCGVYSYNTRQQVAHLRWRVQPFQPDLVVFLMTVTDASGEGVRVEGGPKSDRWEVRWIRRLGLTSGRWDPELGVLDEAQGRMLWLRNRSALVDLLANRTYTWLRGRTMVDGYRSDWSEGSPGRALVEEALAQARTLAELRGFELLVCGYPILARLDDYPLRDVHAAQTAICAELDVPYVDLLPALEGLDARALHAHAHDKHPNGLANRRVAEHLLPLVDARARAALDR